MFIEIAYVGEALGEAAAVASESVGGPIGTLGINLKIFIAQLINFSIVLFVLWKWAWKPIMKVLEDRSRRVEQSVENARRIEEEMKALAKKRDDLLRETEQKAQSILAEAREEVLTQRKTELEKTKAEVAQFVERGKNDLAREKENAVRSARAELAEVVVLATEKILGEKLDAKLDQELVKKVLEKI